MSELTALADELLSKHPGLTDHTTLAGVLGAIVGAGYSITRAAAQKPDLAAQLAAARSALESARSCLTAFGGDPRRSLAEEGYGDEIQAAMLNGIDAALSTLAQEPAGQSEGREKAFDRWWYLSNHNGTLPTRREALAREAFYAAHPTVPSGSASPGVTGDVLEALAPFAAIGGLLKIAGVGAMPDGVSASRLKLDGLQASHFRVAHDAFTAHPTVKVSGDAAEWRTDFENAPKRDAEGRMVEIMIAGGTFYDSMSMSSTPLPFNGWTLACWDGSEWRGENCGGHDEFYYHQPTHWMPKIAGPLTQEGQ